jgi:glycosyltransferase involved in cell wall biosynthesis
MAKGNNFPLLPMRPAGKVGDSERIVVVIPTLNEEAGVGATLDGLQEALRGRNHSIVVVDGRSQDRTVEISKSRNATVIYQKNAGYGDALFTGYLYGILGLGARVFLTVDGDGSYNPFDSARLVEPILSGEADFVLGRRQVEQGAMTLTNRFGNWAISWIARRFLRIRVSDSQSGVFAFRSVLVECVDIRTRGWAVNTEILKQASELGLVIRELPVRYHPRLGQTKLSPLRGGLENIAVALRMMRDAEPLLLFGLLAFVFLLIGTYAGGSVVLEWVQTGTETHVGTAIFSALAVTIGAELVFFALLADMIKQLRRKTLPRTEILFERA